MTDDTTSLPAADHIVADLRHRIDAAVALLLPAYIRNHTFAFWHDVGLTLLGALATVLAGAETLPDFFVGQTALKFTVLLLTGAVTVFAACNQFFKFKSRADACHVALRGVLEIEDEFALRCADPGRRAGVGEEWAGCLRSRIQTCIRNPDLIAEEGSIWHLHDHLRSTEADGPAPQS